MPVQTLDPMTEVMAVQAEELSLRERLRNDGTELEIRSAVDAGLIEPEEAADIIGEKISPVFSAIARFWIRVGSR